MPIFFDIKKTIEKKLEGLNLGEGTTSPGGSTGGVAEIPKYKSVSNLPSTSTDGQLAVVLDQDLLYLFDGSTSKWKKSGLTVDDIPQALTKPELDLLYAKIGHSHNEFQALTDMINGMSKGMVFRGTVGTFAALSSLTNLVNGDTYVVEKNEQQNNERSLYVYDGSNFVYLGAFSYDIGAKINDATPSVSTTYSGSKIEEKISSVEGQVSLVDGKVDLVEAAAGSAFAKATEAAEIAAEALANGGGSVDLEELTPLFERKILEYESVEELPVWDVEEYDHLSKVDGKLYIGEFSNKVRHPYFYSPTARNGYDFKLNDNAKTNRENAYKFFDGLKTTYTSFSTTLAGKFVQMTFPEPVIVNEIYQYNTNDKKVIQFDVLGSDDELEWELLSTLEFEPSSIGTGQGVSFLNRKKFKHYKIQNYVISDKSTSIIFYELEFRSPHLEWTELSKSDFDGKEDVVLEVNELPSVENFRENQKIIKGKTMYKLETTKEEFPSVYDGTHGIVVTASNGTETTMNNLFDNKTSTKWSSSRVDLYGQQWLNFNFNGKKKRISGLTIRPSDNTINDYEIQVSKDNGSTFQTVYNKNGDWLVNVVNSVEFEEVEITDLKILFYDTTTTSSSVYFHVQEIRLIESKKKWAYLLGEIDEKTDIQLNVPTQQDLTTSTETVVQYKKQTDSLGEWDDTTSTFTAKNAGLYMVQSLIWISYVETGSPFIKSLKKGGTNLRVNQVVGQLVDKNTGTPYPSPLTLNFTEFVDLKAGDTIQFTVLPSIVSGKPNPFINSGFTRGRITRIS